MVNVFAIGDLHLSGGSKPMDVFGPQWVRHFEKISADWRARVAGDDLVLIPGDISWAMRMEDALPDLRRIRDLPGRKVLLRGNHDYWWTGLSRLRELLPEGMYALQNDALKADGFVIAGSRLWMMPGTGTADDERIYRREIIRLRLSLDAASKHDGVLIAMTHYPPVNESGEASEASELFEQYGVRYCVYGHLHGAAGRNAFCGTLGGTAYACVSCDQTGFALYKLPLS